MTDQPTPETDAKLASDPHPPSDSPDYVRALEIHIHLLRAELADERAKKPSALIAAVDDIERLTAERDAAIAAHNDALLRLHVTTAERDELREKKRDFTNGSDVIAAQVKRIQELETKLNGWFVERSALLSELADERAKKSDALIAAVDDIQRLRTALEGMLTVEIQERKSEGWNPDVVEAEPHWIAAREALNTPAK